jgi:hypothetical protein
VSHDGSCRQNPANKLIEKIEECPAHLKIKGLDLVAEPSRSAMQAMARRLLVPRLRLR